MKIKDKVKEKATDVLVAVATNEGLNQVVKDMAVKLAQVDADVSYLKEENVILKRNNIILKERIDILEAEIAMLKKRIVFLENENEILRNEIRIRERNIELMRKKPMMLQP